MTGSDMARTETRIGTSEGVSAESGAAASGETSDGDDLCEVRVVHEEAVRAARSEASEAEEMAHLAETFRMLASPTRLRIVEALARRELCVCDLAAVVDSSESAVSHHLRQLRQMKLVRYRKEGRMAYYRLDDQHVERVFHTGLEHVRE